MSGRCTCDCSFLYSCVLALSRGFSHTLQLCLHALHLCQQVIPLCYGRLQIAPEYDLAHVRQLIEGTGPA